MRYVQLRAFHYVAVHGGFSRAAEELCLTQPAISDQVRKLEDEYDILLFNRHKKRVTPTEPGERLLEITRRLFDNEKQALELLSEARALRAGTLRIVADSAHHLLQIMAEFRLKYPGVSISLTAGNSETVVESLHSYEADMGVLGEIPVNRDFEMLKLNTAPIVAFASRDFRAPAQHRVPGGVLSFQQLARQPLVMREPGSRTRQKLQAAAAKAGVTLKPAIEAEGREAVREIVASGAGIGFVSAAEFGHDDRLVRYEIEPADGLTMDEALVCLRERASSKLVRAFFDVARQRGG